MGFVEIFERFADMASPVVDKILEIIIEKWYFAIGGVVLLIIYYVFM